MICLSSLQMPSVDWLKCVQDRFNWDCCPAWCDLDANSWHWGWQSFLLARGKTSLLLYAICKAEHLLAFYIQSLSPGHTPPHILSAIAPMCLYWTVTWCCLWNFYNFAQQARQLCIYCCPTISNCIYKHILNCDLMYLNTVASLCCKNCIAPWWMLMIHMAFSKGICWAIRIWCAIEDDAILSSSYQKRQRMK